MFSFKDGPSDLGTKIYRNTETSSLYSKSLLIFIHKTPVVENHLTTREIRDLLRPRSTPTGNTVWAACLFTYTDEASNKVSDEDIMENI